MNESIVDLLGTAKCVVLRWKLAKLCLLGSSTDTPIEFLGKIPGEVPVSMIDAQIAVVDLNGVPVFAR